MKVPNWQHHSKKEKKRHLKPQALRQARKRRGQLIKCLLDRPSRRFRCYYSEWECKGANEYLNRVFDVLDEYWQ